MNVTASPWMLICWIVKYGFVLMNFEGAIAFSP